MTSADWPGSSEPTGAKSSPGPVSYTHLDVYKRQVHQSNWAVITPKTETRVLKKTAGGDYWNGWGTAAVKTCLLYTSRCV